MADRPISEWLAEPDDAELALPADGAGSDADGAEALWRPRPEEGRTRRLWRMTALAWVALGVLVGLLAAAGRLADADASGEEAVWRAELKEEGAMGLAAGGAAGEGAARDGVTAGDGLAGDGAAADGTAGDGAAGDGAAGTPSGGTGGSATEGALGSAAMRAVGDPVPGGDDSALTAAAALGVRLALTAEGDPARYVDLVAPEAVEHLGDLAIVTVAVVLLEGSAERWESVRPARYAVAVGTGDGWPRVLGTPWPLPGPELADPPGAEPEVVPLDEALDTAAVLGALIDAGYDQPAVSGAVPGAPGPALRVRVHGVAPGEGHAATHDVWLDLTGPPRVLGTWTSS